MEWKQRNSTPINKYALLSFIMYLLKDSICFLIIKKKENQCFISNVKVDLIRGYSEYKAIFIEYANDIYMLMQSNGVLLRRMLPLIL